MKALRCCMHKQQLFIIIGMLLLFLNTPRGVSETATPPDASDTSQPVQERPVIQVPDCASAIVMEFSTGEVVYAFHADEAFPPASMTKMMLAYLTLEKIANGDINLSDTITTSAHASKMGGSQVYLKHGEKFSLEELLKAVIIQSANDASMAIAEYIGGSAKGFVDMMNAKARELGMTHTEYHTPHGLPPSRGQKSDMTSARDLAILARHLIDKFPQVLHWSSIEKAGFRNGDFILTNTNKLISTFKGCDGLKTGYHQKAGFGVTATAMRNGVRVIVVVMGCPKSKIRFQEAARLLTWGLHQFEVKQIITAGTPIEKSIPVIDGEKEMTIPVTSEGLKTVIRRNGPDKIQKIVTVSKELVAPVTKSTPCGSITFKLGKRSLGTVTLVTPEDIPALNWWGKILRWAGLK